MPMVWRQTLRSGIRLDWFLLPLDFCDLAESVDLLIASGSSAYDLGTGKTKSSAGTGVTGPLMGATDFSNLELAFYVHTLVPSILPLLLHGTLSFLVPCENDSL